MIPKIKINGRVYYYLYHEENGVVKYAQYYTIHNLLKLDMCKLNEKSLRSRIFKIEKYDEKRVIKNLWECITTPLITHKSYGLGDSVRDRYSKTKTIDQTEFRELMRKLPINKTIPKLR